MTGVVRLSRKKPLKSTARAKSIKECGEGPDVEEYDPAKAGLMTLAKKQRLDFSLRDQKYVFFHTFFLYLHLKCVFANILLISFIFNNKFMFYICFIIIIDLILP
jgi:hypothetical protein